MIGLGIARIGNNARNAPWNDRTALKWCLDTFKLSYYAIEDGHTYCSAVLVPLIIGTTAATRGVLGLEVQPVEWHRKLLY